MKMFVEDNDWPPYKFAIKKSDGTAYNLTSCTVKFPYTEKGRTTVINTGHTTCNITDAANGKVQYEWDNHGPGSPVDLATVGEMEGEIEITTAAGNTYTIAAVVPFKIRRKKE